MMYRILFFCAFITGLATSYAQDTLRSLGGNATLMQAWKKKQAGGHAQAQKAQSVTAQFLPFADDFSYAGPYPDASKWINSTSVFVNHTKATKPVTIGVATFDGMRADGYPYNPAYTSGSYPSDTLTSIPLRLDSLNGLNIVPTDSVTLRFYYQARGYWEKPDPNDDLYLEFLNVKTGSWDPIWSKGGFSPSDSSFTRVMIAITDTTYLKNGFQFRFRNYSTACGDVDHWHIDAVYMDKKLNPARDTMVPEISFAFDLNSILKNYSQMPFNQFSGAADMQTDFKVYNNLRNNYTSGVNLTTYYDILNSTGAVVAQNTNGTNNVPPFGSGGYCNNPPLVNPSLNSFTYNNGPFADSTSFLLKFYATNTSDNVHTNDTIYYRQKFENYFSYDDGSAEAGYGFTYNSGVTAVRYKLNVPDTLRAIDVYFDPILYVNQLENAGIRMYVWADNNNLPGTVLLIDSVCYGRPVFSHDGMNVFQRYQLSAPVTFTNATTFYIGVWQQLGLSLNIGYDLNTDSHTNVLFNVGGGWNVSAFKGSLMLRPVFGDSLRAVGIDQYTKSNTAECVLLYPNPTQDEFFVKSAAAIQKVMVCDMLGNVLTESAGTRVNIAFLPNGMYLVRTITAKGYSDTQKLLIAR